MVLDSEDQRASLLGLIAAASFQGGYLDAAFALKRAIQQAEILPRTEIVQIEDAA